MEILKMEGLTFRYPDAEDNALTDVSFSVEEGEFVVLCGASGCGKTTLLRHLKQELAPLGNRSGVILYKGLPLDKLNARQAAAEIGVVFQNPESQLVLDTVWHELAFGMEHTGVPISAMHRRLAEMAGCFGLESLLYKPVHELSGGQKQLVNLASVLLLQPRVLLLDEPVAQLDPVAAREFLQLLHRLNQEYSMTVILNEHRLEDILPLADRVVMLDQGRVVRSGTARQVALDIGKAGLPRELAYLPAVTRLYWEAQCGGSSAVVPEAEAAAIPLTVKEGRTWLRAADFAAHLRQEPASPQTAPSGQEGPVLADCDEITFKYEKDGPEVLKKLKLQVREGESLAILGGNGAGKSTLLQLMTGILRPQRGKLKTGKTLKVGYLAQNPLLYFTRDTLREELLQTAAAAALPDPEGEIQKLLRQLDMEDTLDRHPHDLSGGQQQRAALALVLLGKPQLLCVDEPTKGLDPAAKQNMASLLQSLRASGMTLVMVTHDVEFAAQYATRCAMLFDGAITAEGAPGVFFRDQYFYTTAINRVVRDWLPDAVTSEEVRRRWAKPVPEL